MKSVNQFIMESLVDGVSIDTIKAKILTSSLSKESYGGRDVIMLNQPKKVIETSAGGGFMFWSPLVRQWSEWAIQDKETMDKYSYIVDAAVAQDSEEFILRFSQSGSRFYGEGPASPMGPKVVRYLLRSTRGVSTTEDTFLTQLAPTFTPEMVTDPEILKDFRVGRTKYRLSRDKAVRLASAAWNLESIRSGGMSYYFHHYDEIVGGVGQMGLLLGDETALKFSGLLGEVFKDFYNAFGERVLLNIEREAILSWFLVKLRKMTPAALRDFFKGPATPGIYGAGAWKMGFAAYGIEIPDDGLTKARAPRWEKVPIFMPESHTPTPEGWEFLIPTFPEEWRDRPEAFMRCMKVTGKCCSRAFRDTLPEFVRVGGILREFFESVKANNTIVEIPVGDYVVRPTEFINKGVLERIMVGGFTIKFPRLEEVQRPMAAGPLMVHAWENLVNQQVTKALETMGYHTYTFLDGVHTLCGDEGIVNAAWFEVADRERRENNPFDDLRQQFALPFTCRTDIPIHGRHLSIS